MNGDLRVAYRASREGPRDIVFLPHLITTCELFPELPSIQGWLEAIPRGDAPAAESCTELDSGSSRTPPWGITRPRRGSHGRAGLAPSRHRRRVDQTGYSGATAPASHRFPHRSPRTPRRYTRVVVKAGWLFGFLGDQPVRFSLRAACSRSARARAMRERIVPTGQPQTCAASL
jgi:hypothetical protein